MIKKALIGFISFILLVIMIQSVSSIGLSFINIIKAGYPTWDTGVNLSINNYNIIIGSIIVILIYLVILNFTVYGIGKLGEYYLKTYSQLPNKTIRLLLTIVILLNLLITIYAISKGGMDRQDLLSLYIGLHITYVRSYILYNKVKNKTRIKIFFLENM